MHLIAGQKIAEEKLHCEKGSFFINFEGGKNGETPALEGYLSKKKEKERGEKVSLKLFYGSLAKQSSTKMKTRSRNGCSRFYAVFLKRDSPRGRALFIKAQITRMPP